jgi:HNH endonuclease
VAQRHFPTAALVVFSGRYSGFVAQIFSPNLQPRAGRWAQGLTAEKMKECRWPKPVLVGQFEFVEWTPIAICGTPDLLRSAKTMACRGQGLFKDRMRSIEHACRITRVDNLVHLRASHLKPWRDATNEEKLDRENGLLLTPSIDHRLDKGFMSFENSGELIISPVAHKPSLERMGVATNLVVNVGSFTEGQKYFLGYHRDAVLLRAVRT